MTAGSLSRIVGLAEGDLSRLISELTRLKLTVACAESLTGGLLTALLTEVPGASAVVRGGLVVYATDLKHSLAGVDADLLARRGPVDPEVAHALAAGVRAVCGSSVGLGLTGVAGPDPQNGVPVGSWYVAMSWDGPRQLVSHLPDAADPGTDLPERADIRSAAVRAATGLLAGLVANR